LVDYKSSGVDLRAGDSIKSQIAAIVAKTYTTSVLTKGGEFAGVVRIGKSDESIAVSIDGVGTKLKIAFLANKHDTVGEDLVNHCVNDIAVIGSDPICFVDYISIGKLDENIILEIIKGLARGCHANGIPLIGGETAQMPSIYQEGEYDLAGTIIGKMSNKDQLPRSTICTGDSLVGFRSNGIHTNGYSLVRRIVFELNNWRIDSYNHDLGFTWGEELLRVHRSYLEQVKQYRSYSDLRGFAHITGGGIPGNLVRILPENLAAIVQRQSLPIEPVFKVIQDAGKVNEQEMFNVFNLGVGLIAVCSRELADTIVGDSKQEPERYIIGEIIDRKGIDQQVVLM